MFWRLAVPVSSGKRKGLCVMQFYVFFVIFILTINSVQEEPLQL